MNAAGAVCAIAMKPTIGLFGEMSGPVQFFFLRTMISNYLVRLDDEEMAALVAAGSSTVTGGNTPADPVTKQFADALDALRTEFLLAMQQPPMEFTPKITGNN